VYGGVGDGCATAQRWQQANTVGAYVNQDAVWVDTEPMLLDLGARNGSVGVAAGDLYGDGRRELVTADGETVRVFDRTGTLLTSFPAQGDKLAVGDLDGDGQAEIVVSGSQLQVFKLVGGVAVQTGSLPGGGAVAIADGKLLTAASFGPDVASVAAAGGEIALGTNEGQVRILAPDGTILSAFDAYPTFRGPIAVALGDFDGDGVPDLATGAEGAPHVRVFTLRGGVPSPLASFYTFDPASSGPLSLAFDGAQHLLVGGFGRARLFGTFRDCGAQPQGWHEYLVPLSGGESLGRYSFTVSPGFYKIGEAAPYLARDPARWSRNVADMAGSGADWQLVLSFSEWAEGTAVESAREWASPSGFGAYLDALHSTAR
jgi:hypothetical protein